MHPDNKDSPQGAGDARWRVADGRLLYFQKNKGWIQLPAVEIWSAAFGVKNNTQAIESPAVSLPQLIFSRSPAELAIEVTGDAPSDLRFSLVGTRDGKRAPLLGPSRDQVFIENTWYPIRVEDYEESLTTIETQGIYDGKQITVGQLIWLRTHAPRLELVLFESIRSTNPSGVHAPHAMNASAWGLHATLYPYQQDGVYFLKLIADQGLGCILGDEMGLGKTIQVIALMLAEKAAHRGPSLVVTPATLLENWRRELSVFSPSLTVKIHAGFNRAGIAARLEGIDVIVASYDTAVRDEPLLSSIQWNLLALDEAQNIKNPDAQRTLAVKRIPRRISLAITGTPVENRLTDLWSLSDFALPGLLGDRPAFERQFTNTNNDAEILAPLIAPILLRRRVRDVAMDLPERIDVAQPLTMSRRMADLYEQTRKAAIAEYGESASLVALQRLRMLCTHPILLGAGEADPADEMPKYQRLIELLEEIFSRSDKCLIFTSYTGMTNILLKDLPARFPRQYFSFIDGRVPVPSRQTIVDDFSAATAGALFLNPKAAGVGLNITAANHVIHYNPEWNPALQDQASARAYRRKQERPVTIHQMFFVDSVEEVIVDRLCLKRGLAESAAIGHGGETTTGEIMQALRISPLSRLGALE